MSCETLNIVAKGKDWIAVDKPAAMSVHNERGRDLISRVKEQFKTDTVFLVNRLDVGVSGLVLVALSRSVAQALQKQFADRSIEKEYRATGLIVGDKAPEVGERGIWKKPLTKKAESRRNPQGFGGMRVPCKTGYEVLAVDPSGSVELKLTPHSGRKHQIRRHAALAGWPLIGDKRYGVAKDSDETCEAGISLRATSLKFINPDNGEICQVLA